MKFCITISLVRLTLGCQVHVNSTEDCQTVCDRTTECGAWTFRHSDSTCHTKGRYGWTRMLRKNYDSGLKNQGPWYEKDADLEGGDIHCNQL